VKNIGAAMAPNAAAKGSSISQHIQQQQHPFIYLARAQGATTTPITLVNATPITSIAINPITNIGTSRHSPTNEKIALTFDTSSTELKNSRLSNPSTH